MKVSEFTNKSVFVKKRMERLQRYHEVQLTPVFDATDGGYIGAGWLITYAVLNFTVSLSAEAERIPDDVYLEALEIFKQAHQQLGREKSFYCFGVKALNDPSSFSVTIFMRNKQLNEEHEQMILQEIGNLLYKLNKTNDVFQSMYSNMRHLVTWYSNRHGRVMAFHLPEPLDFGEHFAVGGKLQQGLINDEHSDTTLRISGMLLGNSFFFAKLYEKAIEHWIWPAEHGEADASFNIACAYSKLGNMNKASTYCKEAIKQGMSKDFILNDPDLDEFRSHPSFEEIRILL